VGFFTLLLTREEAILLTCDLRFLGSAWGSADLRTDQARDVRAARGLLDHGVDPVGLGTNRRESTMRSNAAR
jgi:hypothetical protein